MLTGASVFDRREAGDIGGVLFSGDNQFTLRQGWSLENDYKSIWTSIEARRFANQKNTTFAIGAAFNDDGVSSHDAPHDYRTRIKRDFFAGVTQIINERSLFEVSLAYSYSNGYLSDPYKLVFVQSTGLLPDARPSQRRQFALTGKYLAYVPAIDSSFQIVESLSTDNWGLRSGALEVQWKKELPGEWLVSAGGRLYSQSSADFYKVVFQTAPGDGLHSSDYRMAAFGSMAWLASVTNRSDPISACNSRPSARIAATALRSGGTGFDGDDYLWSFYLATLRAQF